MKRRHAIIVLLVVACCLAEAAGAGADGELRFAIHGEPKTFDPHLTTDQPSETIRFLTSGVLIRINRVTQQPEAQLARSWRISKDGRSISFRLREGVRFSDGQAFRAEDVVFTFERLMNPDLRSPLADSFRSKDEAVRVNVDGPHAVTFTFPKPVGGLERLFDQVAIVSSRAPDIKQAVLGPFFVAEHQAGSHIVLHRNSHYWKKDARGRRLPYLDVIRLQIQSNRQTEVLRFRRGRYHLINSLDAELYDRLAAETSTAVRDAGPSLNSDFLWFNQHPDSPLPAFKLEWFRSRNFRRAISHAIRRDDIVRVVFRGRATPGVGPVSPADRFWFNQALAAHAFDLQSALERLKREGFRRTADGLTDSAGHAVEFSVVTNAGNKARERMALMIQQDLAEIGIRLNVVALDFPSLIERISRTFDYEACLLGFVNVDLDPSSQMNVWLSSARSHAWHPNQESPATAWEADIDRLMRKQAASLDPQHRKALFDQVQRIVWEQAPVLYLVHANSLSAISSKVRNVRPGVLWPQTFWNVEEISLASEVAETR